jgi:chromosome segregation ATPase
MTETTNLTTIEGLEAEISSLEDRRDQALVGVQEAQRRISEIDTERSSIALAVFEGDPDATEQASELDKEAERLARHVRVAREAAEQLGESIAERKEVLTKALQDLSREEYAEIADKRERVFREAVVKLTDIKQLFDTHVDLHSASLGPANRTGDTDLAGRINRENPRNRIGRLVHDQLRDFLR